MAQVIFGQYSKDKYSFWGYVESYGHMMEFVSPEEYIEFTSNVKIGKKKPYRKRWGFSSFTKKDIHKNYTSYNEEVRNNET